TSAVNRIGRAHDGHCPESGECRGDTRCRSSGLAAEYTGRRSTRAHARRVRSQHHQVRRRQRLSLRSLPARRFGSRLTRFARPMLYRTVSASRYGGGHPSALERRRGRETRDLEDFLLVERLALEQRLYERIELRAMLAQQAQCLLVAFVDDAKNLGIDEARRLFAERLVAAERRRPQIGVLTRSELHHAELVAHSPTRHHIARELRRLFDIVRCTRRPRAIDNLLCRATAQHPYDARAQVGFRIVVSIRRGT